MIKLVDFSNSFGIEDIAVWYVDFLNIKYIGMPKEKRLKLSLLRL